MGEADATLPDLEVRQVPDREPVRPPPVAEDLGPQGRQGAQGDDDLAAFVRDAEGPVQLGLRRDPLGLERGRRRRISAISWVTESVSGTVIASRSK